MCALTSYYTLYLIFYILYMKKYDDTTAYIVFMISWMFLSSLTMIFLIYWQLNGYLTNLFQILRWPDQTYPKSTRNSIKIVYLLYFLTELFSVFYSLGALQALLTEKWIEGLSNDFGYTDGFGADL
uniref:Uncharacterized protein n=1 Tax=Acrobeloides nanus TaxID=290746 RepID=A0A914C8L2_9BILA